LSLCGVTRAKAKNISKTPQKGEKRTKRGWPHPKQLKDLRKISIAHIHGIGQEQPSSTIQRTREKRRGRRGGGGEDEREKKKD